MKTIYARAEEGKVTLQEKELPKPGKGQVLLKAKYSAMSPGTEKGLLVGGRPEGGRSHRNHRRTCPVPDYG